MTTTSDQAIERVRPASTINHSAVKRRSRQRAITDKVNTVDCKVNGKMQVGRKKLACSLGFLASSPAVSTRRPGGIVEFGSINGDISERQLPGGGTKTFDGDGKTNESGTRVEWPR